MSEIISLYESIGRNLGDIFAKGVPTNATGTSFRSDVLIHPLPDQLRGKEVFWYSGVGAGQSRIIGSFYPGTHQAIVERTFDTVPTDNSRFLIFDSIRVEDYENAMNRAIGIAKSRYLEEKVATMQIVATQYEYPVASGMEWIANLRLVPSGNTNYAADDEVDRVYELPPRYWSIERNPGGSYVIAFDARKINLDTLDKEWVRVMGQAKPDFTGTQIAEDLQEFVIAHSTMHLASLRVREGDQWRTLFYMYRDEVRGVGQRPGLEDYIFRYGRGKRVG